MPRSKGTPCTSKTPEASLNREKFEYNSIIEKYIALAHGLPPPPVSSLKGKTKHPPTPHLKNRHASEGKITKKTKPTTHSLRKSCSSVPRVPSSSIEEEIAYEVEESLHRRREELGLEDDYVFEEVVEDEAECSAKKKASQATHNSLTPSRKKSSKRSKSQDKKMLGDITNSRKLPSASQVKSPQRKVRKKTNVLDIHTIITSPQSKTSRKKVWKANETFTNNNKTTGDENKPSRKRNLRERKESLNPNPSQQVRTRNQVKESNSTHITNIEGSNSNRHHSNETQAGNTANNTDTARRPQLIEETQGEEDGLDKLNDAISKAVRDRLRSTASVTHMVQEGNHIYYLLDTLETVHITVSPAKKITSRQIVRSHTGKDKTTTASQQQSISKHTLKEKPSTSAEIVRLPADKGKETEPEQTARRRHTHKEKPSTSAEQQSVRVPADKEKPTEPEQTVRKQTLKQKTSTVEEQQSVRVPADKEKESEAEQIARRHKHKEKTTTVAEQQSTSVPADIQKETEPKQTVHKHTGKEKTSTTLDQQSVRVPADKEKKTEPEQTIHKHTHKDKTSIATEHRILKVTLERLCINKVKNKETKQDQQTIRGLTNIEKEVNIENKQQTSRIPASQTKEPEQQQQQHAATNQELETEAEQNIRTHINKEKKKHHGKHQTITTTTNKETNTQQQQQQQQREKETTTRKAKQMSQPASEVSEKAPPKRERRSNITTKRSEVQKLQKVSVPLSSESCDIPEAAPGRRVTRLAVSGRAAEVKDTTADYTPPPSPQQDHSQSDAQEPERTSLLTHLKANSPVSKTSSTDHSGDGMQTLVHHGDISNSSLDASYLPPRKRKLDLFRIDSEEEENDEWSTTSLEDDTIVDLNVRKKRRKSSVPHQLPHKRKPKRRSRSSRGAADDNDEDIIILTSSRLSQLTDENVVNTVIENQTTTTPFTSPPKAAHTRNWLEERVAGAHHRSVTDTTFSQTATNSLIARHHHGKMVAAAAAAGREQDLGLGDTWILLSVPPVQQSFSYLTSRVGMSLQGSQFLDTTSFRHQLTTTTTASVAIPTNTILSSTFADNTTTTTTKASKPSRNFWTLDSDEEAGDGTFTSKLMSKSIIPSPNLTSTTHASPNRTTGLPDYSTLGPERWMAAVKDLQKKKKKSYLRLPLF